MFISLFKGIYLYDIRFKNVYVKKLFLKIDHKIVLKINGVKIENNKNYTKQAANLNKTILTFTKYSGIFEDISIKSLYYDKYKIDSVEIKNNRLTLFSDFIKTKAILNPDIKHSYVNFIYISIPSYGLLLKNVVVNLKFYDSLITAEGFGELNKKRIDFDAALQKNNILTMDLFGKKIIYDYIIPVKLQDVSLFGKIDLNYLKYAISANINSAEFKYKKMGCRIKKLSFKTTDKNIRLRAESLSCTQFKNFKSVYVRGLKLSYNIPNEFLILNSSHISFKYLKYTVNMKQNELIFKNIKNLNFKNGTLSIKDKTYKVILKDNLLNIFNNYTFYSLDRGEFVSKNVKLKSSEILGDLKKIFTHKIKGKLYGFDTEINEIEANIKQKTIKARNASINNVKAKNITFGQNTLILASDSLFDKNVKALIKKFLSIDVPLTQIGGRNEINASVSFYNHFKNLHVNTRIHTKNSLFKLYDFSIFTPDSHILITNDSLAFKTEKSKLFFNKNLFLGFEGNGEVDFNQSKISLEGTVDFNIKNIINLKNYKEKAVIDFNKNILKTVNSSVFIDFYKKMLIINPLEKILKYTAFKEFVKNGILLITFGKNMDITTYFLLKLPIFYRHNNDPLTKQPVGGVIHKTFLNINVGKIIEVFNDNVKIKINDKEIKASIENWDINLLPLEKLMLKSENTSNDFNYSVYLYSNNANLIYKTHKFLSQTSTFEYKNNKLKFHSIFKHSSVKGYTKNNYLLMEGHNFSNEEFKAFLPKFNFFNEINLDFVLVKSPDDFYTGKIYINHAVVKELKTLNNIIAFINTVPSLLSFSSPGFSSKGYKIEKGYVNYLLYKKILYIKEAKITGENLDFYGKGYVDFNKNYIFLKITANMKMKLKKIPIIGKGLSYLLFGKDGSIDVKMVVKGDINNPKVKEDIGKDILLTPFKLFKRAITLPFNIF